MHVKNVSFMTTNWNKIPTTTYLGETGSAIWKTIEVGYVRIRMVEYSAGYFAVHCVII